MKKALRIMAILAAFGLTAWIGVVALAQSSPTQSPSSTSVGDGDQFKGPCDEAEHANDPACVGVQLVPEDNGADDIDDDAQGEDVNDDHGGDVNDDHGGDFDDDDQGDDEGNDDHGDDNSGPSSNSGPGSSNSGLGSDDSGHGGGDDSGGED